MVSTLGLGKACTGPRNCWWISPCKKRLLEECHSFLLFLKPCLSAAVKHTGQEEGGFWKFRWVMLIQCSLRLCGNLHKQKNFLCKAGLTWGEKAPVGSVKRSVKQSCLGSLNTCQIREGSNFWKKLTCSLIALALPFFFLSSFVDWKQFSQVWRAYGWRFPHNDSGMTPCLADCGKHCSLYPTHQQGWEHLPMGFQTTSGMLCMLDCLQNTTFLSLSLSS